MSDNLKPNGLPTETFRISIDDGYVEWSYDVKVGGDQNIAGIHKVLCESLGVVPDKGTAILRKSHLSFIEEKKKSNWFGKLFKNI